MRETSGGSPLPDLSSFPLVPCFRSIHACTLVLVSDFHTCVGIYKESTYKYTMDAFPVILGKVFRATLLSQDSEGTRVAVSVAGGACTVVPAFSTQPRC